MILKIKKLDKDAKLPSFACFGDAGMDIFSISDVVISPSSIVAVSTALAMEVPFGYVALVWDKSGRALKDGLKTMGGVVDSGYRGEIKVIVTNLSDKDIVIKKGEKVAQILMQKIETPEIKLVKELSVSDRGDGSFGSTGV